MVKKVFVTGATGYIGGHVVDKLLKKGYQVVGFARSEETAKALTAKGASALVGDLRDLDKLEKAAREADAVIHLGFIHDFSDYDGSCKVDKDVLEAFHRALKGTNKPLIGAAGTALYGDTKDKIIDDSEDAPIYFARAECERALLKQAEDGVRAISIKLAPFVYGYNGKGFLATLIEEAKKQGASLYIGEGAALSTFVHVDDASDLYIAALEKGVAGASYNAVGQNDVSFKEIAEAIAKLLKLPTKSVTLEEMQKGFGAIGFIFAINNRASSGRAAKDLGWKPNPKYNVVEDLSVGSYTARA